MILFKQLVITITAETFARSVLTLVSEFLGPSPSAFSEKKIQKDSL